MSDELTFNASDNDVAPESPVSVQMECDSVSINQSINQPCSVPNSKIDLIE